MKRVLLILAAPALVTALGFQTPGSGAAPPGGTANPNSGTTDSRSGKRPPKPTPPTYFVNPKWVDKGVSAYSGGTGYMKVYLGPMSAESTNRGGDPQKQACTAVNDLNSKGPKKGLWVKGHLLNQQLGGPGTSKNLTPLTQKANSAHKNQIETQVVNAVGWCKLQLTQKPNDDYFYGVYYKVTVEGKAYPQATNKEKHQQAVAQQIVCTAYYVRRKKNGDETPTAVPPPAGARPLPGGPVTINCAQ